MFTIGEFSKITGLSVKTLRFYHEEGLLVPTSVDDATGYRYYDGSLVELARTIAFLKGLDFTLAEIRDMLGAGQDEAALIAALTRQRQVIDERIARLQAAARSLDQFLQSQREGKMLATKSEFQCEEKMLPPIKIAAVRMHAPYSLCGEGFAKIGKAFWNQISGPPLLLCYDTEYQEVANYEACMPVKGANRKGRSKSASYQQPAALRCCTKARTTSSAGRMRRRSRTSSRWASRSPVRAARCI
jgi:DNA-binding transcriptional MerR regulator